VPPAPLRLPLLAAALAALLLAGCGGSSSSSRKAAEATDAGSKPKAAKLAAPEQANPPIPAADFKLRDAAGGSVSLAQFRGKAVLLTFIYDHCPDTCPLIVSNLHNALLQMGPAAAAKVQVVAISVDPKGDTPKTVKAFLAAHEMTGRMKYLIGSKKELAPVWRSYGVQVEGSPDSREVGHSAFVYGITGSGKELALYPANFKPGWVAHDVPLLAHS
jgi:protein SCO1